MLCYVDRKLGIRYTYDSVIRCKVSVICYEYEKQTVICLNDMARTICKYGLEKDLENIKGINNIAK
jgi:hypothetical protein